MSRSSSVQRNQKQGFAWRRVRLTWTAHRTGFAVSTGAGTLARRASLMRSRVTWSVRKGSSAPTTCQYAQLASFVTFCRPAFLKARINFPISELLFSTLSPLYIYCYIVYCISYCYIHIVLLYCIVIIVLLYCYIHIILLYWPSNNPVNPFTRTWLLFSRRRI